MFSMFNWTPLLIYVRPAAEASVRETTSRPRVVQMKHAGNMQPMKKRDAGVS